MGKGKGLFERRIIRVSKNTILFEFLGISIFKLKFLIKKINKKLGIKTHIIIRKTNCYKIISNKGVNSVYFNKYFYFN